MKTLHLLRHAKSSWDDASLTDHERPLSTRGLRDGAAMRDYVARVALDVDLVLVSPARRAQQTWQAVAPGVAATTVRTEDVIYEASGETLLRLVRGVPAELRSVLLVGHEPGFSQLATLLAGDGQGDALKALRSKYPTGALASITFDRDWSALVAGCGRLVSFVRPRDLPS